MIKYLAFLLTFLFIATASAQTRVTESQTFVNNFLTKISVVLSSDLTEQEKQTELQTIFSNDVAVDKIARFVLGRYWRSASAEERKEYLVLFKDFVTRSTISRIKRFNDQDYNIVKSELISTRGSEATVLVQILISTPASPIQINWRVLYNGEVYKITDVYITGISLAITYRDEFSSVIRNHGMTGLLNKLRNK